MPLYEYECNEHGKFDKLRPMSESTLPDLCPTCGKESKRIISPVNWVMGFKFLKDKSVKSQPAPEDSGYHPEWDQAYGPNKGGDTIVGGS